MYSIVEILGTEGWATRVGEREANCSKNHTTRRSAEAPKE
jgi:hypothetical protein